MSPSFQTQTIFNIYSEEGCFTPVVNDSHALTPEQEADRSEFEAARVPQTWDLQRWVLHWRRFNRAKLKPDWSGYSLQPMCSAQTAQRLWPAGPPAGVTLLPITVGGEAWYFVVCTHHVTAVDPATSSVFFDSAPEEQERSAKSWEKGEAAFRVYLEARDRYEDIVNLTDSAVANLDLFRVVCPFLPETRGGRVYCTERFKSRCEGLGIKGVGFYKAGYIVDGPANAVMPKKLERVQHDLPRWTQAREANPEALQKLQQAGQHWYVQKGFGADTDGLTIVRAIEAVVQHHGDNRHKLKKTAWAQLALELEGAWGLLLERDLGWQWLEVAVSTRTYALALQTPNASHAHCLSQVLAKRFRRAPETTLELTYNMLKAGNLPPGEAGQRVCLG